MTARPLTETTRELACLALGHDDSGAPRCPESDERLVADLVAEVQHLRVLAGVVEESEVDREDAAAALVDVSAFGRIEGITDARDALEELRSQGWTLTRARRG